MKNIFAPPVFADEGNTRIARLLYITLWTFIIAVTTMVPVALLLPETTTRQILLITTVDVSSLLLLVLTRHGHVRLVSWLVVLQAWVITTALASTGGGVHNPVVLLYFVAVLVAGLILGEKAGIITAGVCIFTQLLLVYAEEAGMLLPSVVQHNAFTIWVSQTGAMIIVTALMYLAASTIRESFDRVYQELRERKKTETELRESEELYTKLILTIPDVVIRTDIDGTILYVNEGGLLLRGYTREEVMGKNMLSFIAPEDVERAMENTVLMLQSVLGPREYSLLMKDGTRVPFEVNGDILRHKDGTPYSIVLVCRDISERKDLQDKLRTMAITDELTGLYNRRGFITLAEQQLKSADRNKERGLMAFIDLDGMKHINDIWGHEEGDRALVAAAGLLRETYRESDIIARVGGDEFAVLALNVDYSMPEVFINRLQERLDAYNAGKDSGYRLSMSVGSAFYEPDNPCSLDELMSRADRLMYEDKHRKAV